MPVSNEQAQPGQSSPGGASGQGRGAGVLLGTVSNSATLLEAHGEGEVTTVL